MEEPNERSDEVIGLLKEILEQSSAVREEIKEAKGYGLCSSLSDICDKPDSIQNGIAEKSRLD